MSEKYFTEEKIEKALDCHACTSDSCGEILAWALRKREAEIKEHEKSEHCLQLSLISREKEIKRLEAACAGKDQILKRIAEAFCECECPSVWKTGTEQPHCENCKAIKSVLSPDCGSAILRQLEAGEKVYMETLGLCIELDRKYGNDPTVVAVREALKSYEKARDKEL